MKFLVDYNLDGYAMIFAGVLCKQGWLELVSIDFVTFQEAGLAMDASDRVVWDYAQANQMILLTANRNMDGEDSLERVIQTQNDAESLPVVTISNLNRLYEFDYRELCGLRLVEIVLDIEDYRGAGRLFVP